MAKIGDQLFYAAGKSGVSAVVGFESKQNRVVRYALNLDDGEPARTHIHVFFDESDLDSISIQNTSSEHLAQFKKLNAEMSFYFAISTEPEAFANAGYVDISRATKKAEFTPYRDNQHFKVTCDADVLLYPGIQYYLWIFPGFSLDGNSTWGWVSWGRSLTITAEASGTAEYAVTYDAGDGSGAPEDQTKTHGEDLVLSGIVPTRKGYSFRGWATEPDGDVAYQPGDSYATDEPVALYAVWQVNRYTDTFDPNGGTGGGSFTGDYGTSYQAPKAARELFAFAGWKAGEKQVEPGQTVVHDDADDMFYAQWTRTGYRITCDPSGGVFQGSEEITSITVKPGEAIGASIGAARKADTVTKRTVTLKANGGGCLVRSLVSASRTQYTFAGWYDQAGAQVYDRDGNCVDGAYWKDGLWVHTDDLQIVAGYSEETEPFEPVELPAASRVGYRFQGWSTDPEGGELLIGTFTPREDVTLYAVCVEAKETDAQRCRVRVNTRGRNRAFRVLVKTKGTVIPCAVYLTVIRPLTATHDGAGTVTLHGDISVVYDGNGTVRLVGAAVAKYEDGTVTIKGGIR